MSGGAAGPPGLPAPAVWAPLPERVELVLDGRRHAMRRDDEGWWSAVEDLRLPPGTDYGFSLDGGAALPDPRSPWQPAGVHGLSRTIDHGAFRWTDDGWRAPPLSEGIVYELHVGTFTPGGTFDSAVERLDALADLGVSHVELMPVAEFPGRRGWGYDGVDLFAPHDAYGGPLGLKRLVDACHGRGLAVLLDVVYNHVGPDGNYLPRFGPYLTDRYRLVWGDAINLDGPGSDEVRRFFVDNALGWLRDYHLDGLRLDAVHALFDQSAVHFLEQLAAAVARLETELDRRLVLVAESDLNDPRLVRPVAAGGYGIDAQWSDDFHHALHTTLTGERQGYYTDFAGLPDLARALQEGWVYVGQRSAARGRRHGRPPVGVRPDQLLGYLQNHDQIGNRALGERSSQLLPLDALEVAAALVLTAPFVPLLFQGEEWAAASPFLYFTDHQDPRLGEAVRAGRQAEFAMFGWPEELVADPQSPETFARSRLDWSERERAPHRRVLDWHRRLIRARRSMPGLHDGRFGQLRYAADARWLTHRRGEALLVCNLAEVAQVVPLGTPFRGTLSLASKDGTRLVEAGIEMPPVAAALLAEGD